MSKRLIWIPILHSPLDQQTLSTRIRKQYIRRAGTGAWEEHIRVVRELWKNIHGHLARLELTPSQIRIYHEGLVGGTELTKMVADRAQSGSLSHQVVLNLVEKGARIEETECAELLAREESLLCFLQPGTPDAPPALSVEQQEQRDHLFEMRDRYISERIGASLNDGEVGLLFLGMLHSLRGLLPPDIPMTSLGRAPWQTVRRRVPTIAFPRKSVPL